MNLPRSIRKVSDFDILSKLAIINIVVLLTYFLSLFFLGSLYLPAGESVTRHTTFQDLPHTGLNVIAIILAICVGSLTAIIIRPREDAAGAESATSAAHDITLIKSVLSPAEQTLVSVLEHEVEITQDSLAFRLGWSRPKLSTVITNLERRGVVQRRREGKTYVLFLAKK